MFAHIRVEQTYSDEQCLFMTRKKKHINILASLYHWLYIAFHNTFQPEHSELILYISKWDSIILMQILNKESQIFMYKATTQGMNAKL
jgi:hypothetical protein